MKKFLAFVLCALLISLMAMPAMAAHNITVTAPKGTVTIDGVKDSVYSDFYDLSYCNQPGGATGKLAVAWDDDNIYCYIEVNDVTPFHDNETNWQTDNVEFFFDWNNHKGDAVLDNDGEPFWQARIHSAPGVNDFGYTGHANGNWDPSDFDDIKSIIVPLSGSDLSKGYIIEAAFPKAAVEGGMTLTEGKVLGFDVTVSDAQNEDERYSTSFFFNHEDYDMSDDMWTNPSVLKALLVLGAAPADPVEPDDGGNVSEPDNGGDVVVTPKPPKTGDNAIILIVLGMALASAAVVVTKRLGKNKA